MPRKTTRFLDNYNKIPKLCKDCKARPARSPQGRYCFSCRQRRQKEGAERSRQRSSRNLGERYLDKNGYARLLVEYEDGSVGHVAEHRYVMEQKLGRKLVTGESVHHKDGIRDNNAPDNLELWVGGIRYGQRAKDIKCPHCGQAYLDGDSAIDDPADSF